MALPRRKTDILRQFIIENLDEHSHDIVLFTSHTFKISRQAVHNHIKIMKAGGILTSEGAKRNVKYKLKETVHDLAIKIGPEMKEDVIWRGQISPILPELNKNVYDICQYGVTEMLNNVIDHSGSSEAEIVVSYDVLKISFLLVDHGVGIFRKIQESLGLEDPKFSILELAKGKLTTDPSRHSGEGIFFTSRVFDDFDILSEDLYFHGEKNNDWLLDKERFTKGTAVLMSIKRNSARTTSEVFGEYSVVSEDYGFLRTKVPVRLLRYEGEELVSRSQAKRLISRFEKFKEVILDFDGVKTIGQPFADEVFRIFTASNPGVKLSWVNTTEDIGRMIKHVTSSNI